jgi:molybdopterin converting factor small subunit
MDGGETVTVEFYGLPRQRAGRAELAVPAGTVVEMLRAVEMTCPGLEGLVQADGRLSPHYLLSVNGERFVDDLQQRLHSQDRILLLSADAGG